MDINALHKLTYGLFIASAREGEKDNGCIINTVCQVANSPERVSIAVSKKNFTHDMILHTGMFNVSILDSTVPFETFRHFGFQSGRDVDKMAGVSFKRSENGIVYFPDSANAFLSGKVVQSVDLGSHTLFIAEVTDGEILSRNASVTYADYFDHIKPKPQKKEEPAKKGWICTICGYIYEGDPLPADFICPVCKHPASDFRKL